ncbi:unnamed protein product [Prorocentrum cordatum]|uniref:Uncharacterized protein n=1 Tax=Prorocentrum cordatum TaxID=2364126 RepID=A0ABN9S1I5_9DINO|nr:unnamed protein product [Polarella glacialis]
MVVKTRRLDSCVCLASVLTLGLYYFFRPTRDMALLALTTSGRVLLVKREHDSILGSSPGTSLWFLMRVLLVLLGLVLVPLAVWIWLGTHGFGDDLRRAVGLLLDHPEAQELRGLLASQTKVYAVATGLFWAGFVAWVWVHRQRGYGARYRREFKAASIAAAQYIYTDGGRCRSCCVRRQRASSLRLFFGKYPTQQQLDERLASSVPEGRAVRPLQNMGGGAASVASDVQGTPRDPAMDDDNHAEVVQQYFPCMSIALLIGSLVAQGYTFASYVRELQWVVEASSYCQAEHAFTAPCTPSLCRQFAAEHAFNRPQFCDSVRLVSDDLICQGAQQPCCSGCVSGEILAFLGGSDPVSWAGTVNTVINYCTLLLALFASSVIVRHALGKAAETACLDLEFVQDCFNASADVYQMRDELASEFLNRVFQGATLQGGTRSSRPPLESVPVESRDAGAWTSQNMMPVKNVELVSKDIAPNWMRFFQEDYRLVTPSVAVGGECMVRVPTQCLGFMKDEAVLKAWTETPFLTPKEFWYLSAAAAGCALALVYYPTSWGGPLVSYPGEGACEDEFAVVPDAVGPRHDVLLCALGEPLLVLCLTLAAIPFLLAIRYFTFYSSQQCAVIVTTQRIFTVYFRPTSRLFNVCRAGVALRVEVFRHGGQVFYGRMTSRRPPWIQRLFMICHWKTGELVMQSRRGVLAMERMMGNIDELYDLVATQLSKDLEDLKVKDAYVQRSLPIMHGVQEASCRIEQGPNTDVKYLKWTSSVGNDPAPKKVITIAAGREEPIYMWSFVDNGSYTSPYRAYNDVVVTSDRIRLRSCLAFKTFDCRSCCCWCACFCSTIRQLVTGPQLPIMRSFLNFSHLAAFSTETSVKPRGVPVECPAYSALCACLTAAANCSPASCPGLLDCCRLPGSAPPRVQLWLKWMQRNAKAVQPDLVLSAKPYELREPPCGDEDEEAGQAADDSDGECCAGHLRSRRSCPADSEEVEDLRALMQLVLRREEERRARQR